MELYLDQMGKNTVDMPSFPNKTAGGYNLQCYGCDILKRFFLSWKLNITSSDQNYIVYTHLRYLKCNYIYIKEGTLQNVSIIFNRSQW